MMMKDSGVNIALANSLRNLVKLGIFGILVSSGLVSRLS